jgi:glycyl-tRNA synthetase beta chain
VAFIRLRFENEQIASGLPRNWWRRQPLLGFDDLIDCLMRIEALDSIRSQENFGVLAGSIQADPQYHQGKQGPLISMPELLTEPAEQRIVCRLGERCGTRTLPLIWEPRLLPGGPARDCWTMKGTGGPFL